jgi:predicted 2-oxoglutarate/Fe(II)-dependent dioxygenase YbiX
MDILVAGSGRRYFDGDSLDHSAPLVWTLPRILRPDECAALIARIEALGPTDAPITTSRGFVMMPDVRNNQRVMFDDVALAGELFGRIAAALPARLCEMRAVGANERFRCYRYTPGQWFKPHYDGAFVRNASEHSLLTLIVYLNHDFEGGRTAFLDFGIDATPQAGSALLFQHRLLHEGCSVVAGTKYVLRSDVMYRAS